MWPEFPGRIDTHVISLFHGEGRLLALEAFSSFFSSIHVPPYF